jgi:hypothetical protein
VEHIPGSFPAVRFYNGLSVMEISSYRFKILAENIIPTVGVMVLT